MLDYYCNVAIHRLPGGVGGGDGDFLKGVSTLEQEVAIQWCLHKYACVAYREAGVFHLRLAVLRGHFDFHLVGE